MYMESEREREIERERRERKEREREKQEEAGFICYLFNDTIEQRDEWAGRRESGCLCGGREGTGRTEGGRARAREREREREREMRYRVLRVRGV
jgi:hypothetical protein